VDAERTSLLGAAQVRGYQDGGLLATVKHFPGHGDSPTDTHARLATLARTREDHEQVHLPPFRAAVVAGVASVMVAHVALPAFGVDGPASLSPLVNRTWLREDLAYNGIVVTDALRMGAVAAGWSTAEAAVAALAAGADVANVKCPADEIPAILDVLEAALADGVLDGDELDVSVARLLRARAWLGLDQAHGIDLARSAELDAGQAWSDPELASTVSTSLAPEINGPVVVVGSSELARRLAFRLSAPWETGPLATVAHPGATLVAVTCPLPADGGRDSVEFAAAVQAARADGRSVIAVVNSAATAANLRVEGPSVSVPAVDAFEMVSDAAVAAVVAAIA
jgi:beta-glucosidase-like glycosyl hydrolase